MDNSVHQPGEPHLQDGHHDESDLSIRGIVMFGVVLAVLGLLTFVGMRYVVSDTPIIGLEWWEKKIYPVQLTPAEQQLQKERAGRESAPAGAEAQGAEISRVPEAGGRKSEEDRLQRTFPAPRLQYDDTRDMRVFRGSEDAWLESTGKAANGDIHIPVSQAMDLIVKRGLPPVSGSFVPPTLPSAAPLVPAPAAARGK